MIDNTFESHSPDVSKALSVPSEETIEFPFPYLKIPNGYPEDDKMRRVLDAKNEPSEDVLKEFFTPEVIQRLIYCPQINRDMTDDWGMFGYEPGYIFVCERRYEGAHTLADEGMLKVITTEMIKTASGVELMTIPHYDYFPRHKFITQEITAERTPKTFAFLRHLLENVDPNNFSTYPAEDLYQAFKNTIDRLKHVEELSGHIKKQLEIAERNPEFRDQHIQVAEDVKKTYTRMKEQIPQNIERYLSLINEIRGRKEATNPSALRLFGSFKDEQMSIQAAIEQARQRGDNELANTIEKLREATGYYREDKVYLSQDPNKKPPELNNGK